MKKRRDLDALVQNKKTRKKRGQHSLLRDASESSDNEEFSVCEKSIGNSRKNSGRTCGYCALGLASVSLIFFAVLLWFTMKLSYDISTLQKELKQYQRLPKPTEQPAVFAVQKTVKMLTDRISSIERLSNKTISGLAHRTDRLNSSIVSVNTALKRQSAPKIDDLTKELTNFGSKLKSVENDLHATHSEIVKISDRLVVMNNSYHDGLLSINQEIELLKIKFGKDESQDVRNISEVMAKVLERSYVNSDKFTNEINRLKETLKNLSQLGISENHQPVRLTTPITENTDQQEESTRLTLDATDDNSTSLPTITALHPTGSEKLKEFLSSLKATKKNLNKNNFAVKLDDLVQYSGTTKEHITPYDTNHDETLDKDELYKYFKINT